MAFGGAARGWPGLRFSSRSSSNSDLTHPGHERAESNAAQVLKVRQIIEGLGLEVASPDEAREILALKGGDEGAF